MWEFKIDEKKLGIFTFSEWAGNFFLKKHWHLKVNKELCVAGNKIPHAGDTEYLYQCW